MREEKRRGENKLFHPYQSESERIVILLEEDKKSTGFLLLCEGRKKIDLCFVEDLEITIRVLWRNFLGERWVIWDSNDKKVKNC